MHTCRSTNCSPSTSTTLLTLYSWPHRSPSDVRASDSTTSGRCMLVVRTRPCSSALLIAAKSPAEALTHAHIHTCISCISYHARHSACACKGRDKSPLRRAVLPRVTIMCTKRCWKKCLREPPVRDACNRGHFSHAGVVNCFRLVAFPSHFEYLLRVHNGVDSHAPALAQKLLQIHNRVILMVLCSKLTGKRFRLSVCLV